MQRLWIGEIPGHCTKTVLVAASSRKEAEAKLERHEDVEGIGIEYGWMGKGRIIREDTSPAATPRWKPKQPELRRKGHEGR